MSIHFSGNKISSQSAFSIVRDRQTSLYTEAVKNVQSGTSVRNKINFLCKFSYVCNVSLIRLRGVYRYFKIPLRMV